MSNEPTDVGVADEGYAKLTKDLESLAANWLVDRGAEPYRELTTLVAKAYAVRAALCMSDLIEEVEDGLRAKKDYYLKELAYSGLEPSEEVRELLSD